MSNAGRSGSSAGNDEAANKFKDETRIPVYKWSVADYDACAAGIQQVEADLGPIDILVPNAGGPPPGTFASTPVDVRRRVMPKTSRPSPGDARTSLDGWNRSNRSNASAAPSSRP